MTHVQSRDRLFIRLSSFKSITSCLRLLCCQSLRQQPAAAASGWSRPPPCWRRRRNLSRGSARNAASLLTGQTLSIACITAAEDIQAKRVEEKKSFHSVELVLFRLWFSKQSVCDTPEKPLKRHDAGGVGAQCEPRSGGSSQSPWTHDLDLSHQCSNFCTRKIHHFVCNLT